MALFDNDDVPDNVEKSRLFDTLKGEDASSYGYLKHLLPVVLFVGLIGAAVIYFYLPGEGDEVKAPPGLEVAVKNHFLNSEKRPVTEANYFYCKDYYWVRVVLERRADITARVMDAGNRRVVGVEREPGKWEITPLPFDEDQPDVPCSR